MVFKASRNIEQMFRELSCLLFTRKHLIFIQPTRIMELHTVK